MRGFVLPTMIIVLVAACSTNPAGTSAPSGPDAGSGQNEGGGGQQETTSKVNVTSETLDVEGTTRAYTLGVPKSYDQARAYPLVLVFHGDGGDGPGMRKAHPIDVYSGDDAIIAWPTGIDQGWNIYEPSSTNKDMKFVDALVAALSAKLKIDAKRVFGVGYSSGGYLINQIACRKNGFLRGIVVHAGGAPNEPDDPAAGTWPTGYTKCAGQLAAPEGGVATMAVHGENDSPEGGEFIATYWASLNGCQDTRSPTTPSPCEKHEGCPKDKPVVWCKIPGLGHSVWENGVKEGWAFIKSL